MRLANLLILVTLATLGVTVAYAAIKSDSTQVIYYDFHTDDGVRCISTGTNSGGITCNWGNKDE